MGTVENMGHTEEHLSMARELNEFKLAVKDLINCHEKLLARNEELEKENKRLHETILQMSQKK